MRENICVETIALFKIILWAEEVAQKGFGKLEVKSDEKIVLYLHRNATDMFSFLPWVIPTLVVDPELSILFCAAPWFKVELKKGVLFFHAGSGGDESVFVMLLPVDATLLHFFSDSKILSITSSSRDTVRYIAFQSLDRDHK